MQQAIKRFNQGSAFIALIFFPDRAIACRTAATYSFGCQISKEPTIDPRGRHWWFARRHSVQFLASYWMRGRYVLFRSLNNLFSP